MLPAKTHENLFDLATLRGRAVLEARGSQVCVCVCRGRGGGRGGSAKKVSDGFDVATFCGQEVRVFVHVRVCASLCERISGC